MDIEDARADAAELVIKLKRQVATAHDLDTMKRRHGPEFRKYLDEAYRRYGTVYTGDIDVAVIYGVTDRPQEIVGRDRGRSDAHARPRADAARTPAPVRKGRASHGRSSGRAG